MLVGYGRVSQNDQNLDLQQDALTRAGCEKVFTDKMSGARADRPGLAQAIEFARKGDVLTVWRLDRLARSLAHLIEVVQTLEQRGVGLKSLNESIDTTTPGGKLIFHVFGALAEFERSLIRQRTTAGLAAARERGRVGGRPRSMTPDKIDAAQKLLASGTPPRDVAKVVGVSLPTFYRWLPAAASAA